jgi:phosphoribosylamine--glycine ligase
MKILVVGGGGREHAIIKKLKQNPEVTEIVALPGNAGIARDAQCVPIRATDIDAIADYAAKSAIDFAACRALPQHAMPRSLGSHSTPPTHEPRTP